MLSTSAKSPCTKCKFRGTIQTGLWEALRHFTGLDFLQGVHENYLRGKLQRRESKSLCQDRPRGVGLDQERDVLPVTLPSIVEVIIPPGREEQPTTTEQRGDFEKQNSSPPKRQHLENELKARLSFMHSRETNRFSAEIPSLHVLSCSPD